MGNGTLFVVATPIGNLGDITRRALDVLRDVAAVACEDTRRTRQMLRHFQIDQRLVSFHDFNERSRSHQLLEMLLAGQDVALVSDAGTPQVSDPGHHLLAACAAAGIPVVPVPGASALAALLSVSHLPVDRFVFCGFPPARAGERRRFLQTFAALPWSLVFYEAPHRIGTALRDMETVLGDRPCLFGRELTKLHEEILRLPLSLLRKELATRGAVKGEIALLVAGAEGAPPPAEDPWDRLRVEYARLSRGARSRKEILRGLMEVSGLTRNQVYQWLTARRPGRPGSKRSGSGCEN
jgi:16S rRNA (cytidine1402-2'-O)-methyltransferase